MKDAINPDHYKQYPKQVIDIMICVFGKKWVMIYCIITAFKYRMRMGHKDDMEQDFNKEEWYLNKAAELTKRMKK